MQTLRAFAATAAATWWRLRLLLAPISPLHPLAIESDKDAPEFPKESDAGLGFYECLQNIPREFGTTTRSARLYLNQVMNFSLGIRAEQVGRIQASTTPQSRREYSRRAVVVIYLA